MHNEIRNAKLRIFGALFAVFATLGVTTLLAQQSSQPAGEPAKQITDLSPYVLRVGVNHLDHFTPEGGEATIVKGWRYDQRAKGYYLFVVLLGDTEVAGVDYGNHFEDAVRDEPNTGGGVIKSLRFAQGRFNGKPATFLITATRELPSGERSSDPATVVTDFYQLGDEFPEAAGTHKVFKRISEVRSTARYCSSDVALFKEIGLPLPFSYTGNTTDGCS
jgi:hypothetical protein